MKLLVISALGLFAFAGCGDDSGPTPALGTAIAESHDDEIGTNTPESLKVRAPKAKTMPNTSIDSV